MCDTGGSALPPLAACETSLRVPLNEHRLSSSVCNRCSLLTQCCHDAELDPYYILHYTYGDDYTLEGAFTPGKVRCQSKLHCLQKRT